MIVRNVIESYIVHQTEKVEKCIIREESKNGKDVKILQTQGINLDVSFDSKIKIPKLNVYI